MNDDICIQLSKNIMAIQTPFLCLKDFKAVILPFCNIYLFILGCARPQLVILCGTLDP